MSRIGQKLSEWANQRGTGAAWAIATLSSLLLLPAFDAPVQGDVAHYRAVAEYLRAGKIPYRDLAVEYPPYAVVLFVLPRVLGPEHYAQSFMLLALAADGLVKVLLFRIGSRDPHLLRSLLPLLCYSSTVPFIRFFYLQRYDVWPALFCLLAISLYTSGRPLSSGSAIAIGIGLKLYPVVLVLPLLVLTARRRRARRFLGGVALGLLPAALAVLVVPWWRFAEFQATRGLQVESLYASVLWLGNLLGLTHLRWEYTRGWYEVRGSAASALLPWARGTWLVAATMSTALATAAAVRLPPVREEGSGSPSAAVTPAPALARLLLVPLLGFVAFNPVLSPQFMIWLMPLAAVTSLHDHRGAALGLGLATAVTAIVFPSLCGDYTRGLNLLETVVLVCRNLVLVLMWAVLIRESFQ